MQTGPIYFLTPRKCSVFGVHCEAIPRQINFPMGEVRKGANAVISRLYYFIDIHCLGETDVFLDADNCTGQNKNNVMMNYLMWRVMTGRHTNITLLFFWLLGTPSSARTGVLGSSSASSSVPKSTAWLTLQPS